MEIKNLHAIPEDRVGSYLTKLDKAIQGQTEFQLRIIDGKTSKEDIKFFLDAVRSSKTYQKHEDNYQFRVKADSQGNQFLTLKQQGLWSRFLGVFGVGSDRRGQERADAIRQIDRLMGAPADIIRAKGENRESVDSLLRQSQRSNGGNRTDKLTESASYQEALQFHRDLMTQHGESKLLETYETIRAEIDHLYGARGVAAFEAALVDPSDSDSRLITQETIRSAMSAADRQMSALLSEVQRMPQSPEVAVRADLKEIWDGAGNYNYDEKTGLLPEYAKVFPKQVLKDLERSTVSVEESGALVIRNGTSFISADALNNRCETFVAFFENGSGVSRDKPEFENMFKNFIRNFHQGGVATMATEVGRHQSRLGLRLEEFNFNGNETKSAVSIRFQGRTIEWGVSHDSTATFLSKRNLLAVSLQERFAIPVDALKKNGSTLDVSAEVTVSKRAISIMPKPVEKPSALAVSAKTELMAAWESAGTGGVIESDRINNLSFQFPVQALFHIDVIVRGQVSVDRGTLVVRHGGGGDGKIATNLNVYEQFLSKLFRDGSDNERKVASENLSRFLTQASDADISIDFFNLARDRYEAEPKNEFEFAGVLDLDADFSISLSDDYRSIVITQTCRSEGFSLQNVNEDSPNFMGREVVKMPYAYTRAFSIPLANLIGAPFDSDSIQILSVEREFPVAK